MFVGLNTSAQRRGDTCASFGGYDTSNSAATQSSNLAHSLWRHVVCDMAPVVRSCEVLDGVVGAVLVNVVDNADTLPVLQHLIAAEEAWMRERAIRSDKDLTIVHDRSYYFSGGG